MSRAGIAFVAGALGLLASGAFTLPAQAQATDGAKLFAQHCAACHQVAADAPQGMGPNLRGVVGRQAGQVKGFAYSAEFKKALAKKKLDGRAARQVAGRATERGSWHVHDVQASGPGDPLCDHRVSVYSQVRRYRSALCERLRRAQRATFRGG